MADPRSPFRQTNVPNIRLEYRNSTLMEELWVHRLPSRFAALGRPRLT